MTKAIPQPAAELPAPVKPPVLLDVQDLKKHFPVRGGLFATVKEHVKAVDGVSFKLAAGQTLGLVGESGCGKTTVGRSLLRLIPATAGRVLYQGKNILKARGSELLALRQQMQIIFQDPYGSLNPRMTVEQIVGEGLRIHGSSKSPRAVVALLLERVGLRADAMFRYPHEFSGGQRQRIGIARALAVNPQFIVCDEPTSALDVSIRAQIINLLQELQQEKNLSYLMISHDLGVVRHISDHVAVMYLGKIVEQAPTEILFGDPRHPYTAVLLSAIPSMDPAERNRRQRLRSTDTDDSIPSPINLPPGCPFHPRCPLYQLKKQPEECRTTVPELWPLRKSPQHLVRCHFRDEAALSTSVLPPGEGSVAPEAAAVALPSSTAVAKPSDSITSPKG